MAIIESAPIEPSGIESLAPGQSIREYLGLQIAHLLPGLDVAAGMLRRGEHDQALRTYATLVLCDPSEIRFQIGLATCALEIREFHIALQAASAVIASAPDSPMGYLISGRASLGLLDFDAAIDDLQDAIRVARETGDDAVAKEAAALLQRAIVAKEVQARN
ncbi:tetratricopeptide (TPR) repeat protein [Pseudochelatococcus lubricantis]|uniref:Tetratricopeptide (TPR) repeat protein n=1 Tax=Pseudochelatococcus lubricantis TaxID=1538102 RepID=A0ABX0UZZ2_9HYPH|nr:hypothetical protein [Pseudochelatococcus lubricantis]NIJ58532.1 tetratricopeptide (TPR) repeat protein [Pseudochelatococcus lubricantis]